MSAAAIPKSATAAEGYSGIMDKPDAWTHGRHVRLARYTGMKSMGYKTDYQHVPAMWLVIAVEGERHKAYQFTGKRIAKGEKFWRQWVSAITPFLKSEYGA